MPSGVPPTHDASCSSRYVDVMSNEAQTLRLLIELERIDETAARSDDTSNGQVHQRAESAPGHRTGQIDTPEDPPVGLGGSHGLSAVRLFRDLAENDFDLAAAIVSAARGD